jgi:hypothetical protein
MRRRARRAALASVDISLDTYHEELSGDQLSAEMMLLDRAQEAIKLRHDALSELAKSRLTIGQPVSGFALERSLGHRKWLNHATPELIQMMSGVDVSKIEMVSPAKAKKAGVPDEVIESFTERPSTGVRLVRSDIDAKARKLLEGK